MNEAARKIRVLVAKPGIDGHDRGAKIIAQALRDHGMEVIYTGIRQSPKMISTAAIHEDVDVVGLSFLSGSHLTLTPLIMQELRQNGGGDILVIAGGVIPDEDIPVLKRHGIREVFVSGASTDDIARFVQDEVRRNRDTSGAAGDRMGIAGPAA